MRSDTTPRVEITWDATERRWSGPGVRGETLGRLRRSQTGTALIPAGQVVTDLLAARALVEASKRRLQGDRQRYKQLVMEMVTRHNMRPADVAALTGVSREWINQLIKDTEGSES